MSSRSPFPADWPARLGNTFVFLVLVGIGLFCLWHTEGNWWIADPGWQRWSLAAVAIVSYLCLCMLIGITSRSRAGTEANSRPGPTSFSHIDEEDDPQAVLVTYASQTGFAEELASRTMDLLRQAGQRVQMTALHQIDLQRLSRGGQVLFVASTTGEGDPPDHALRFVQNVMQQPASLGALQFGVLALGDRQYAQFCAFGRQLDQWLRAQMARPMFDLIEVDNADEKALARWQTHIQRIGLSASRQTNSSVTVSRSGGVTTEQMTPPFLSQNFQAWQIKERYELNPGTSGGKVYYLSLIPPHGTPLVWTAGDIVEILPRHAPQTVVRFLEALGLEESTPVVAKHQVTTWGQLARTSQLPPPVVLQGQTPEAIAETLCPLKGRQYSIASIPDDEALHLVVRRVELAEGQLGIGSGWLCDYAALNEPIELRIRSNPNFHPGDDTRPVILIGNGTGIAGLRSHLKARIQAGARRNWLLFGERNAHCDFFFRDEIEQWQASGWLDRVDLAFSRDQPERIYVQQKLRKAADELRQWVADGASLYVCGSLKGMAPAVDQVMREVLGDQQVTQMLIEGRYRRDVY